MSMTISGAYGAYAPQAMSGASATMPQRAKMTSLYNQIDSNGTGSITQSQFNQAYNSMNVPSYAKAAGAGAIWQSLDPSNSGSVTKQNFIQNMTQLMTQLKSGA